jgi:hypothetical protein
MITAQLSDSPIQRAYDLTGFGEFGQHVFEVILPTQSDRLASSTPVEMVFFPIRRTKRQTIGPDSMSCPARGWFRGTGSRSSEPGIPMQKSGDGGESLSMMSHP